MTTWILIFMVIRSSPAITNVPGFNTQAACEVAAKEMTAAFEGSTYPHHVCVRQDPPAVLK